MLRSRWPKGRGAGRKVTLGDSEPLDDDEAAVVADDSGDLRNLVTGFDDNQVGLERMRLYSSRLSATVLVQSS